MDCQIYDGWMGCLEMSNGNPAEARSEQLLSDVIQNTLYTSPPRFTLHLFAFPRRAAT
jgi:hypothetical protein